MASWNIPALINKISDDVPAIKTLLTALFKWTDADTTDVPVGAKRLEAVTGGRQIQEKTASGWASVGKLMHDVDKLDGWDAAQSALANTVAVRDSNGKLNGDILGNANTATTASSLAQNYVAPIANGGTGATSAANARANLGANNGSNINTGVVGTAYGGTGRTDGKVTDVHLTDYNTGAVGVGQLGFAAAKNAVSADSLVIPGVYFCTGCTTALKYPSVNDCFIRTEASGEVGGYTHLVQNLTEVASAKEYRRVSHDGGASWEGWIPVDHTESADVHIYVSKGGSDASTGLASDSAVLTKGRALDIAMGLKVRGQIVFHFGPGEWGDLTVNGGMLQCDVVRIANYPNSDETIVDVSTLVDNGNYGDMPPNFNSVSLKNGVFSVGCITSASNIAYGFQNTDNVVPENSFPIGTRMLFQQSAAPTGWTKETDSGYNNIALRLTTGNVANKTDGKAFTTCMAAGRATTSVTQGGTISDTTAGGSISKTTAGGTVGNRALSVAQLAKHRHDVPASSGSGSNQHILNDVTVKYYTYYTSYAGSGSNHNHGFTGTEHGHTFTGTAHNHTFTGSAHNHTIDLDINYIDCIIAVKA